MKVKLVIAGLLLHPRGDGILLVISEWSTKLTDSDTILIASSRTLLVIRSSTVLQGRRWRLAWRSRPTEPGFRGESGRGVASDRAPRGRGGDARTCSATLPASWHYCVPCRRHLQERQRLYAAAECGRAAQAMKLPSHSISDAASKSEVLHSLGLAATKLRERFGEDVASIQKFDVPLERAATTSLDALKAYSEGRRLAREKGAIDAVPALKQAIEADHRFALAHSNLAVAYYNSNQNALAAEHIRQAFELADRQTVRDRLHITTLVLRSGHRRRQEGHRELQRMGATLPARRHRQRQSFLGIFLDWRLRPGRYVCATGAPARSRQRGVVRKSGYRVHRIAAIGRSAKHFEPGVLPQAG